jgi:hypothetical protein
LGTKAGRLLASEESLSLRQLLEYGVNVKQVGLITSDGIPKTSKFKFIEFAKQYLPNAEKFCLKGTNFTKAGYYYAIIGFDGTTPDTTSDHLVFLTLDQVKLLDAMKVVSDSSKDLEAKLSILHEYSYS